MFVSDVSHSAPIKSYFNHSYIMSCCFSSSSLVFTGPRCPWGPVYGSRCLCLRDLWLKRCCIFCIPLRHWREFSISKCLVRISIENSRSTSRINCFVSRSLIEIRDVEKKILDLVSDTRYRRNKSRSRLNERD